MEILELFPTVVGIFQCPEFDQRAGRWRAEVQTALKERHESSSVKRTPQRQTSDRLYERPQLSDLMEFFMNSAEHYMTVQKYSAGITLRLQCCWATVAFQDDRLEMHQHPNSFLSGAFYLDVESSAEPVVFRDPRPQNRAFDLRIEEDSRANLKYWTVSPENGRLLVFPSWLEHKVGPNRSVIPRVSLSFNITLHGEVGHLHRMTRALL